MIGKIGIPVLAIAILFSACSKNDDSSSETTPAPTGSFQQIGTPPTTMTQKVLLEYYSAAWSGTCPDADSKRDQLIASYPGKIIPISIHQSDGMAIPFAFTMDATFGSNPAYGMINRKASLGTVLLNRTQWLSNATSAVTVTAPCGLAINSSVSGTTANIEVQASFRNYLSGNYNLTVMLVEDNVTGTGSGYDQVNNYNADPSSAFYNQGNPILGYKHQYVVRKLLTAALGDPIDPSKLVTDGLLKKNYSCDITGMASTHVSVIAFVNKLGTTSTTHQVMNAQVAKLGVLKNWD